MGRVRRVRMRGSGCLFVLCVYFVPTGAGSVGSVEAAAVCPQVPADVSLTWRTTNCFNDSSWVQEMHRVDSAAEGKVFVVVGCNTGITSVRWLQQWGSTAAIESRWSETLKQFVNAGTCGQNYPMQDQPQPQPAVDFDRGDTNPTVLCVEPVPSNVELLHHMSDTLLGDVSSFEIIQAAVSDHEGTAYFENHPYKSHHHGYENGQISDLKQRDLQYDEVPQITIDQMLHKRNIRQVDVLVVDVEGHDSAVLRGAEKLIAKGALRMLIFEVHQDFSGTPWAETTLLSVVEWLDHHEFDCFWAGNDGLLRRLTGCWDAEMEKEVKPIGWSNVMCVRRGDIWHSVAERHSTRTESIQVYNPVKRSWNKMDVIKRNVAQIAKRHPARTAQTQTTDPSKAKKEL